MSDIVFQPAQNKKSKPDMSKVAFGSYFTDHMFVMNYEEGKGWHSLRIVPYAPFELDPATTMLHYGQGIFEGMKAYRTPEGHVQLFRPHENIRRMNKSAQRLCIPEIDEGLFMSALDKFIAIEKDWVPSEPGTSLYLRPFIFAADAIIGLHVAKNYIFSIIACPVGNYYEEGINPVSIFVEDRDVRAVRGGVGEAKTAANYAASIRASQVAADAGYTQVLWLDGVKQKYIEEVGSMNVMFKIDGRIVTPALQGSVLDGITRKSCIELLRSWDIPVVERQIAINELVEAVSSGKLEEAFGTGTAAVVSPIGLIAYGDKTYKINNGKIGETTQRLYDQLTAIQWGKSPDLFGWTHQVV